MDGNGSVTTAVLTWVSSSGPRRRSGFCTDRAAAARDDEHDLTVRQTAILLTIYLEPPPHTVRGLAARLNVTKPVITRALDTMGGLELLERRRDPADKRNVLVRRTVKGSLHVSRHGRPRWSSRPRCCSHERRRSTSASTPCAPISPTSG